ncbi:chloride channel protein [Cupriavidus sp. 2KB_3]|uniref:chloride channel protein n=1 Tax=Cupriavidus TaxID=106589 RepID=UPI0016568668|nr:chloride channel protein [Cupriavidus campinensis]
MPAFQPQLAWLYLQGLAFAIVFGAVGACAAHAFRWALERASASLFRSEDDVSVVLAHLGWHWKLAVPIAGGVLAGVILLAALRYEKRSGTSGDYLEVIDGRMSSIPTAPSLLRCLSSFFSILSGGSVGKEGAMVQLSATIGSICSRWIGGLHGDRFQLAIATAATGGLAAVYHTPLAAAIFIAEIAFGGIEFRRLALLFAAAVAATWLTTLLGQFSQPYLLPVHEFKLDTAALLVVMFVGVSCGLTGSLLLTAIRFAKIGFAKVPGGLVMRMALGGLLVGGLIVIAPEVAGNGFAPISQLLRDEPVSAALFALLVLKILATAATVGSGAVGGLFTPSLLIGALTGMGCVSLVNDVLPIAQNPILFGVVGMAAALAATTQAPLMSTLMVFEMTREPLLIFPIMLATVVGYGTTSILGQTGTYAVVGRHRERFASRSRLMEISVDKVMRPLARFVLESASVEEARNQGLAEKNRFVFVLDQHHAFVGAVWMHDLMAVRNTGTAETSIAALVSRDFPTVCANERLRDVWETVVASPAERIPVLADPTTRRVVGVLHKSVVLEHARELLG